MGRLFNMVHPLERRMRGAYRTICGSKIRADLTLSLGLSPARITRVPVPPRIGLRPQGIGDLFVAYV